MTNNRLTLLGWLLTIAWLSAVALPANGQPITPAPDGTNTLVTPSGNRYDISGGALNGDKANLFHSFTQFNLSEGQIANFLTNPNIQNILGRINGGNPSLINGLIQVTGGNSNLFLMNPSGMIFGPGARLNVPGSFNANTATGIGFGGNQWFSAIGNNNWTSLVGAPNSFAFTNLQPGSIVNTGNLTVPLGQSLTLMGGSVINTGLLNAPGGQITIAAVPGQNLVRISQTGNLLSLEVQPTASQGSLPNDLTQPVLSLPELLTGKGVEQATGLVVNPNGEVVLTGGMAVPVAAGTAIASGNLNVSGNTGGTASILGDKVGIITGKIDASGINGGGTVLVGGDYQGLGIVPNAARTFVSGDSTINADAVSNGNGGRVIVWADETTRFNGNITARGGLFSGNGGFVEVSGKQALDFQGLVDLRSPFGIAGTLLLDPTDITINAIGDTNGTLSGGVFTPSAATSTIKNTTLQTQLGLGNVIIYTASAFPNQGDITVSAPISWATNNSLTLNANNNININNNITTLGGKITLNADSDNLNGGRLSILSSTINTNGGNFLVNGRGNAVLGNGIAIQGSTINAGGGNINLNGVAGNAAGNIGISMDSASTLQTTGSGNITLNGTGGSSLNSSGIVLRGPTISSVNGDITLTGSGNGIGQGIYLLSSGVVESTGTGSITMTGTGVNGTSSNIGIFVDSASTVRSLNGNISLKGTGNGTGSDNTGIKINATSTVRSTGAGNITLNGTGGNGTSNNAGISIDRSIVRDVDGDWECNEQKINFGGKVSLANNSNVTLNTGLMNAGDINFGGTVDGGGNLTLTTGTGIINLNGAIGGTVPLGSLKIANSLNVTSPIAIAITTTGDLTTGDTTNPGRAIALTSTNGTITTSATGAIDTNSTTGNGGPIALSANKINAGNLNSSSTAGNGGNITLTGNTGDILATPGAIWNSSSSSGSAGDIAIATPNQVGANVIDANGLPGTGNISISGNEMGFSGGVDSVKSQGTLSIGPFSPNVGIRFQAALADDPQAIDLGAPFLSSTTTFNAVNSQSLTTNAGGTTQLNGNVTTTSTQTYGDAVTIANNPTIAGNGITFNDTVNGNSDLTVNAGIGNVTFTGAVGNSSSVTGLQISGKIINANSAVNVAGNVGISGDTINLQQTLTTTNNGTLTLSNTGNLNISNNLNLDGAFIQNGAGSVALNGNINTTNDNISFSGPVTLNAPVTFGLGNGKIAFGSTLAAGNNALSLTAGEIDFSGKVSGTNALTLQPATAGQNIVVGGNDNNTPALDLIASEMNLIQNGFSSITIGRSDSTGNITIPNNLTFSDPVNIQTKTGSIALSGNITGNDNSSITLNAPTLSLNGGISTTNNIAINGNVKVGNDVAISSGTGNVSVTGAIDGDRRLNIDAGKGNVLLQGNIGQTTALSGLNVTASNTNLGGNVTTNNGEITINSALGLSQNAKLSSGGGNIAFGGAIDSINGSFDLNLAAGSGSVTFGASVGATRQLGNLTIANAGNVTANSTINAQNLAVNSTGNINLLGDVTASNSGNGGAIALLSPAGTVNVKNLTTSGNIGGNITVVAKNSITAGQINSSATVGNAGNVSLDPIGDIQVGFINAQGGTSGTGGDVSISSTGGFFGATDSFPTSLSPTGFASISTAGGTGGGNITITHAGGDGGAPIQPFVVGGGCYYQWHGCCNYNWTIYDSIAVVSRF